MSCPRRWCPPGPSRTASSRSALQEVHLESLRGPTPISPRPILGGAQTVARQRSFVQPSQLFDHEGFEILPVGLRDRVRPSFDGQPDRIKRVLTRTPDDIPHALPDDVTVPVATIRFSSINRAMRRWAVLRASSGCLASSSASVKGTDSPSGCWSGNSAHQPATRYSSGSSPSQLTRAYATDVPSSTSLMNVQSRAWCPGMGVTAARESTASSAVLARGRRGVR